MGWAVGYDDKNKRDVGYGVPCDCDHPDCNQGIHRGLYYVCGGSPNGGEHGCGLHFCDSHLEYKKIDGEDVQLCEKCASNKAPFIGKPDIEAWRAFKKTDPSWQQWREENPELVKQL